MIAVGTAGLQAASPPTLLPQQVTKPWSVSASVRGFYDDNYSTLPNGLRRDSFGFEVSPSIMGNIIKSQTQLYGSYKFGLRYYEDRVNNDIDYNHLFSALLKHNFTERYSMTVWDDLVIAQEPMLLNPAQAVQTMRINGNNLRNTAGIDFRGDLTEHFAVEPGYSFTLYDYRQSGRASYSALLDRHEHLAKINLRWVNMLERTDGILGYQFEAINHTSNDTLDPTGAWLSPDVRDTRSHYYFAGADYSASQQLTLSGRAGAQTVVYEGSNKTRTSPYLDLSATYRFQEQSTLQVGYKLSRITTDLLGWSAANPTSVTVDQLAHFVYARVNHTISRLTLSAGGQYQFGKFRGGLLNSMDESFVSLDLGATYKINPFLAAEAGYAIDLLYDNNWQNVGAVRRDYHRNFVFIGLKATY